MIFMKCYQMIKTRNLYFRFNKKCYNNKQKRKGGLFVEKIICKRTSENYNGYFERKKASDSERFSK